MAAADVQEPVPIAEPSTPDYLLSPDAVLGDSASWRYGSAPDYSKTRTVWEQTKQMKHEAGSLPSLVENLVKNWEVEASFKSNLADWRTVDHANYTFSINGGPPQSADHMLKVGTYNAILAPNEFYGPEASDFATSHKTFKRMMPTFAWEVLEVYSGPPKVAFRWRHWGTMKNDYVGFNSSGKKVTVKGHGGQIDIQGVTVAQVDEQVRLQKVETWFDPMEMFRQIAPKGITDENLTEPESKAGQEEKDAGNMTTELSTEQKDKPDAGNVITDPSTTGQEEEDAGNATAEPSTIGQEDKPDAGNSNTETSTVGQEENSAGNVITGSSTAEQEDKPDAGNATAISSETETGNTTTEPSTLGQEDKPEAGNATAIPRNDETETVTTHHDGVDEKVPSATDSEGRSGIPTREKPEQEAAVTHEDMSSGISSACPFLNQQ